MKTHPVEMLGVKLAEAAMTLMARTCRAELAVATDRQLEASCKAMRAKAREVVNQLLDDAREVPWMAQAAFAAATLDLASAGISALKASEP